jgi:hypothetical protein
MQKYLQVLLAFVIKSDIIASCLNTTEANNLYSSLLIDYNSKLLPLKNQSEAAEVGVFVYLRSINTFDELSGELALTLIFNFTWTEQRMSWFPEDYDGKKYLLIAPEDIWRPKTFVRESFDNMQEIGQGSDMLRINHEGIVVLTMGSVTKITCPVDVTFFPFDRQYCSITLTSFTVRSDDVRFLSLKPSLITTYWTENSRWFYENSSVYNFAIPDGPSGIKINFTLKRRSEFYTIYIVTPLVFLGGMNNLVFSIPASSGERTSVAIATFLSFAVYMQIVNNNVPQSSSPIAYIYYYLMFLLLYSSYIMFMCIVSMRIYDRKGKIPIVTKYIVYCLRCMCFKRMCRIGKICIGNDKTPTSVINVVETDLSNGQNTNVDCDRVESDKDQSNKDSKEDDDITWTHVGETFDIYCSWFNFLVYWTITGFTIICLYSNAEILKSFR